MKPLVNVIQMFWSIVIFGIAFPFIVFALIFDCFCNFFSEKDTYPSLEMVCNVTIFLLDDLL
jgi:hypothetical protein